MLKKIICSILCFIIALSLVSCSFSPADQRRDKGQQVTDESEAESETVTETEETTEEDTTEIKKIYLDATEEDFDDLISFYTELSICHFLEKDFNSDNVSLPDIMPAVKEYVNHLYGNKTENIEYPDYQALRYHGLISYDINYSYQNSDTIKANRKTVDPLFRFKDWPENNNYSQGDKWYDAWFYSIDAETVEWMITELFGGTPDRDSIISDADTGISCYYCDGRYYFQDPGGYGGGGFKMQIETKKQDEEGKYTLTIGEYGLEESDEWKLFATDKTTVALIEKNGERFWKIINIDWDKNHF